MIQFRLVAETLLEPHRLGPGYPLGPFSLLHDGGLARRRASCPSAADQQGPLLSNVMVQAAIAAGKRGPGGTVKLGGDRCCASLAALTNIISRAAVPKENARQRGTGGRCLLTFLPHPRCASQGRWRVGRPCLPSERHPAAGTAPQRSLGIGGSKAANSLIRENARQMSWAGGRIPMRGSPGPSNLGTGKPIFRPEPWQWKGDFKARSRIRAIAIALYH